MKMRSRAFRWAVWKTCVVVGVLCYVVAPALYSQGRPPVHRVVAIRAGRLFDGKTSTYLNNQVILITDDRITDVGANVQIPAEAMVIDLSGATVMPGLIDTHLHMMGNGSPGQQWIVAVQAAQQALYAGWTTALDCGSRNNLPWATIELKNAINAGTVAGPRMQVVGPVATPRGGAAVALPTEDSGLPTLTLPGDSLGIASPWEARRAVRILKLNGADWVKTFGTWDFEGEMRQIRPDGKMMDLPSLTLEEDQALADEAHRLGLKVASHLYGSGTALHEVMQAGFDLPMHVMDLDDESLKLIVQKKVPVQITFNDSYDGGSNPEGPRFVKAEAAFKKLLAAGVALPFGSGSQGAPASSTAPRTIGKEANEFAIFVKLGMTPAQSIQTALMTAANILNYNWAASIGSIEKGKYADVIAVAGDPLKDISEMERVKFVMKGGEVVRNDLDRASQSSHLPGN